MDLKKAGKLEEAKKKLNEFLKKYPQNPFAVEAKRLIEEIEEDKP